MIQQLMTDFITGKSSLKDYLKAIVPLEKKDIQDIYAYSDTTHMDETMHAFILLWALKYQYMDLDKKKDHIYLSYLSALLEGESITHTSFLEILPTCVTILFCTTKEDIYFFINHSSKELLINIPKDIQYQTLYCFNCNDDMTLTSHLDVPEFSFYALKK